jgi:propanol-preferring alcohol dehydrogenase
LIGAKVPGQEAARECIEFSIRKNIFPEVNPRKFRLEDINDMISLMKEGMVQDGRMVVQFF